MTNENGIGRTGFFALFMGACLVGELIGVVCETLSSGVPAAALGGFSFSGGREDILAAVRIFAGTAVFMAAIFMLGFFPVGQPVTFIVMALRGLGQGAVFARVYLTLEGTQLIKQAAALVICHSVTAAALALACCEAVTLSNAYLRHTFADRIVLGMRDTVRLYVLKFVQLTVLAACGCAAVCLAGCFQI